MPLARDILTKCFQIRKYEITSVLEENDRIVLEIERIEASYCGKCGCVSGRYDSSCQEILIGSLNLKPIYARAKIWRVRCYKHGVVTEAHGISEGKKRHSKSVEKAIIKYTEKLDNQATAELFGISKMTIYRIDLDGLSSLEEKYLSDLPKPTNLSVDEVSYKRGHSYASVISDYKEGKVLWLEKGRSETDLKRGYNVLGDNLLNVKCVAMDLWKAFENATKECLPDSNIVYDKFHISRLLNRAIENERRDYQKSLPDDDRKIMKKHSRWVLLKRDLNLTDKNRDHLEELKNVNKPLYEMYLLKESFLNIFDQRISKKEAKEQIITWIKETLETKFDSLKRFAKSILKRIKNILNWFSNRISNGKAEGINNVIKTLLKRAYGYKNFEYFRLKVLQKCGMLMNYTNP